MPIDPYLISVIALACALPLVWWLARRGQAPALEEDPAERLDTLIGWPPEPMRILRSPERLAFSTLKLALPGYLVLAQVPLARFVAVPKRNSYAEWMRRVGSQCVDFVICDVNSQVVAVVEVRPPNEQIDERIKPRLDRLARVLKQARLPLHVWNEARLPSIEAAREKLLHDVPAVPPSLQKKPPAMTAASAAPVAAAATGAVAAASAASPLAGMAPLAPLAPSADAAAAPVRPSIEPAPAPVDPFADPDREWTEDDGEVIEVQEPRVNTWYDELDEPVSAELPPFDKR